MDGRVWVGSWVGVVGVEDGIIEGDGALEEVALVVSDAAAGSVMVMVHLLKHMWADSGTVSCALESGDGHC